MSNKIQVFQFEGHSVRAVTSGEIRRADGATVQATADEPWFVGQEVCGGMEYGPTRITEKLDALDDDEKGYGIVVTPGGSQEVRMVSEAGVYKLGFGSRKPAARRLTRWVSHEVLPSIRRTGSYGAPVLDLAAVAGAVASILIPQFKALLSEPVRVQPVIGPTEGRRINGALTKLGRDMHLAFPEQPAGHYRQTEVVELREALDHWGAWADLPSGKLAAAGRWIERRLAKTSRITGPRRQQALVLRNN